LFVEVGLNPPLHDVLPFADPVPFRFPLMGIILIDMVALVLTTSIALTIRVLQGWRRAESRQHQVETEKLRSELAMLKLQLSPHFLFNTLNNIYAQIASDPIHAQQSLKSLARLLRYLLYESSPDTVPLQGELDFIQSIVHLMKLRLPRTMHTEFELSIQNGQQPIAPLILLPLVENVFKHGVVESGQGTIFLSIRECDGVLEFRASNPYDPRQSGSSTVGGIGLANLRKRLEISYPGRHEYQAGPEGDLYNSRLKLFLEERHAEHSLSDRR